MRGSPQMVGRSRQERGAGTPVDLILYGGVPEWQFSVHNGHSLWGIKTEQRIRHQGIDLPVSERELHPDSSRVANKHAHQVPAALVYFKEHSFAVCGFLREQLSRSSLGGFGRRAAQLTIEHRMFWTCRLFIDGFPDPLTDSRHFHAARQQ